MCLGESASEMCRCRLITECAGEKSPDSHCLPMSAVSIPPWADVRLPLGRVWTPGVGRNVQRETGGKQFCAEAVSRQLSLLGTAACRQLRSQREQAGSTAWGPQCDAERTHTCFMLQQAPLAQRRRLRLREIKFLVQGHTAIQAWGQHSNPSILVLFTPSPDTTNTCIPV